MTTASLQLNYVSQDELAGHPPSWWNSVLGVVGFERAPSIALSHIPIAASMTPALGAHGNLCEVWRVSGLHGLELSSALVRRDRMHYRYCDEFLFGSIVIPEDGDGGEGASLLRATMTAYQDIFAVLEQSRHPHLIRVWNYLPEINREVDGDERYRHFNSARQSAFRNSGRTTEGTVPAACALGSPAGSPISIHFLAARRPPRMIENPRQTSAYHYPPKFGSHSPTFSRACVLRDSAGTNLFVSGTASIVGHETIHEGDVTAQTRETLANIHALLDEANRVVGTERYALEGLKFKVYVRRRSDLPAIEHALSALVRAADPIVYLQADVCRQDLLVEIEATGVATCESPESSRKPIASSI
jgi:enamine deaminase RidA (YjgF/YER057c/UK114 family)